MILNNYKNYFFFFYNESHETLEHVDQTSCGHPVPAGVQGQVRLSFEQPGLFEMCLLTAEGIGLDDFKRSLLIQTVQ